MNEKTIFYYTLRIANFCWQLALPMPLTITTESQNFIGLCDKAAEGALPDCRKIWFEEVQALDPVPEDALSHAGRYFYKHRAESIISYCLTSAAPPYAEVHFLADGNIICRFLPSSRDKLKLTSTVIMLLSLETLMLGRHTLLLHSSFVRYKGQGILFSAPSGTGKSTQGDLWEKYRNAQVINGDRTGIFQKDGVWTACGLPCAGSSSIYVNESAPIRAIVYLDQGKTNTIHRLSAAQAFQLLYPQILIHHWDADFVEQITDLLIGLLTELPAYYLSCTPDEGAVKLLEETLNASQGIKL